MHQLAPDQHQETTDQEDHGFTDDVWLPNNVAREKESSVLEKPTDADLCQAIENTFLNLSNVAVVKQQSCDS